MIIGNENNINNNNFWNIRAASYSKIKSISIKMIFFVFVFLNIYWFTYKLYNNNNNLIYIKKQKKFEIKETILDENLINHRRELDKTNRNISSNDEKINLYMNKVYSLTLNLTSNEYVGNWSQLSMKNKFFDENINKGNVELYFKKIIYYNNLNYFSISDTKPNPLKMDLIIKEGNYVDRCIKLNFTLYINNSIMNYFNEENNIIIQNINTNINIYKVNYLVSITKEEVNNTNITLKLKREDYLNSPTFKKKDYSPFYKANINISSKDFNITIDTKISINDDYDHLRIYSFILSFFGFIEIYYCSKLIMKMTSRREIAHQLSSISIAINCYIKLVICIIHFYLSIFTKDDEISYHYGLISIIYFFGFVGFELKLFILVFRIKNGISENRNSYTRNILCLYFLFYVGFTFIFYNLSGIVTNFYLIFTVYIFSWLGQILFSLFKNSRPPMSRLYIVWHSLSILFLPIYIKGFYKNIFDIKPSYLKVAILIIIVFFESILLILQKGLGPRFIIPKMCRKQNQIFDYYRDKVNIEKHVSQNPVCVICLENLNVEVDENFNKIKKKKKPKTLGRKIMNVLYLDKLNRKIKNCLKYLEGTYPKKKYMITPCDHVFHTVCLEKWMKIKNECPYCKNEIPQVD